jgi:hypothetical protein
MASRLALVGALIVPLAAEARQEGAGTAASDAQDRTGAVRPTGDAWRPVVRGRLKNGLSYAILPRPAREPGVGLLMRVEGGFIAERRPGERGLAHLIEHVVFHSPTRTAPDQLDRFLRVGLPLTFPAPTVATTTWRESNYFVSSRETKPADIDALLGLFREVAGELTFRADAVDRERASVMREMAEKKPGNEINARYIAAVAPGSPTDVIDGQNSDDVPTASIETIRGLYRRLYRPENMMVVIVGDVDAAQMKALIRKRFGDWRGDGRAPVRPPFPRFRSDRIAPVSYSDAQAGSGVATISVVMPTPPPAGTRRRQAEATLMDRVAARAVINRLALAQPGSAPNKFGLFIENGEYGHRLFLLWDNFAPGQWRPAVAGLKKLTCELGRAGLSEQDWAAAKQDVVRELEGRARDMAKAPNVELAKDLSHALADGRELIPPDEMLAHARALLPALGAQAMNRWWRRQWRAGVEHIRVETPELAGVKDPRAAISQVVDSARRGRGVRGSAIPGGLRRRLAQSRRPC